MAEPSTRHGIFGTLIRAWTDHPCWLTRAKHVSDRFKALERANNCPHQTFQTLNTTLAKLNVRDTDVPRTPTTLFAPMAWGRMQCPRMTIQDSSHTHVTQAQSRNVTPQSRRVIERYNRRRQRLSAGITEHASFLTKSTITTSR